MVVLDRAVAGKIKYPRETGFEREWLVVDLEGKPVNPARDLNRIGERSDFECFFVQGNLDTLAGSEGFKIFQAPLFGREHVRRKCREQDGLFGVKRSHLAEVPRVIPFNPIVDDANCCVFVDVSFTHNAKDFASKISPTSRNFYGFFGAAQVAISGAAECPVFATSNRWRQSKIGVVLRVIIRPGNHGQQPLQRLIVSPLDGRFQHLFDLVISWNDRGIMPQ